MQTTVLIIAVIEHPDPREPETVMSAAAECLARGMREVPALAMQVAGDPQTLVIPAAE